MEGRGWTVKHAVSQPYPERGTWPQVGIHRLLRLSRASVVSIERGARGVCWALYEQLCRLSLV